MLSEEKELKRYADKLCYRILKVHDGLCDFKDLMTGMIYSDAPIDNTIEYFKSKEKDELFINSFGSRINRELFDVVGSFKGCGDGKRKTKYVLLLRSKKKNIGLPWAIKGPDGTRSFHDFNSMVCFALNVFARERPLSPADYDKVIRAQKEHVESGKPFEMPTLHVKQKSTKITG